MDNLEAGSVWEHRNGCIYTVQCLANTDTQNPEKYPVTVIYKGKNGKTWARPMSDWHRSMTLKRAKQETDLYRLTKREQIAAMAMQGILSNAYWNEYGAYRPQDVSEAAVEYADALLLALSAGKGGE